MKLSPAKIQSRLRSLRGWSPNGDAIVREFTFNGFPEAIAFVTRLAFDAQEKDHHPEITINYKRVTVSWTTHSAGGVTEKDVQGARTSTTIAAVLKRLRVGK